jgi:probable phosphoglycerate mutase
MTANRIITRFGLLRHAETMWNLENRIQSHSDSPLSARGERQAIQWGEILKDFHWDRILSSDTGRAFETARRINLTLKVPSMVDARLREQNWGRWTGKTLAQVKAEEPGLWAEQIAAGWRFCPPEGEDRLSIWKRSRAALVEAAKRWPDETVLVVTHEGIIKSLIYRLSGRKFLPHEKRLIRSLHLHRLIYDSQEDLRLEGLNAISICQK